VVAGRRRALAKAITLVESTRADHQERAAAVLDALLQAAYALHPTEIDLSLDRLERLLSDCLGGRA